MAKNSKEQKRAQEYQKKQQQQAAGQKNQPANNNSNHNNSRPSSQEINKTIELHESATQQVSAEVLREVEEQPVSPSTQDLKSLLQLAETARTLFMKERDEYVRRSEAIQKQKDELDRLTAQAEEKIRDVNLREQKLTLSESEMNEREEALLLRELDAEAGFAEKRRIALQKLTSEAEELRAEIDKTHSLMRDERRRWDEEKKIMIENFDQEMKTVKENQELLLATERQKIDAERQEVQTEKKKVLKEKERLSWEIEDFAEQREEEKLRIERQSNRQIEKLNFDVQCLQERLDEVRKQRDELERSLQLREEADRRFGCKNPEELLLEIDALRKSNEEAVLKLSQCPPLSIIDRLHEMEGERSQLLEENYGLIAENRAMKDRMAKMTIAATELETLRDQKSCLEKSRDALREAKRTLEQDVEELIKRNESKTPFPACSKMDTDDELMSEYYLEEDVSDLKAFVKDLQQRIAADEDSQTPLYYSLEDLRCFVAGMATSNLVLLQGISGTGKTSLPLAFARAVGGGNSLIPVQAGWRDKHDLLGHFNSFEHKYYETEFLKGLYRSQCPAYKDRIYIIVLDEMNLSYVEQYFADILSTMEMEPSDRLLDILTSGHSAAPRLFVDGGSKIRIPQNVWFVGTANKDETTLDFAPKTYDRSHVMELPQKIDFNFVAPPEREAISFPALAKSFEAAVLKHQPQAESSFKSFTNEFSKILASGFRIGWGNRLEKQVKRFVSVSLAAGGSVGEAMDHIFATKILYRLRDRHDVRAEDLKVLQEQIFASWAKIDQKHTPKKSQSLIEDELKRVGGEG